MTAPHQHDDTGQVAEALPAEPGHVMPREQFEQVLRDAAKAKQK